MIVCKKIVWYVTLGTATEGAFCPIWQYLYTLFLPLDVKQQNTFVIVCAGDRHRRPVNKTQYRPPGGTERNQTNRRRADNFQLIVDKLHFPQVVITVEATPRAKTSMAFDFRMDYVSVPRDNHYISPGFSAGNTGFTHCGDIS